MYDAVRDPYCYKNSTVLKNRLGLRDAAALIAFEAEATAQRFTEPFPSGRFGATHYCAVHRHIFGDVYAWAGRFRSVRIAKGGSMFCYPEHIGTEIRRIFGDLQAANTLRGLPANAFSTGAAHFLAELNAVHAFRDGNGRTQLAFLALLADHAGHPLDFGRLDAVPFLAAMIDSFHGREAALAAQLQNLL